MTKTTPFALALLAAFPLAAAAQEQAGPERYRVRAEFRWWLPGLNSQIQKGFGPLEGTLLDLEDDLGVSNEDTWEAHGAIRITRAFKLVGSYIPIDYSGDQAAPFNFTYGDELFFRNEQVVTNLHGQIYAADLRWEFFQREGGYFGALLGARVIAFDNVILAPASGKRVVDSETVPVPVLGLNGRGYLGKRFSVEGTIAGMSLGDRGHLWDFDLSARVHFSDRFAIQAGYRRFSVEGTDERDFVTLSMGGWAFGVELSL